MNPQLITSIKFGHVLKGRHRTARIWQSIFFLSTSTAILALATLIFSIVNQSFGYIIVVNKIEPQTLSSTPLDQLTNQSLIEILKKNLNKNRIRTLERDLPLAERSQTDLYTLVLENVVQPKVVKSYNLDQSIFDPSSIKAEMAKSFPNGELQFRSWVNASFLTGPMSPRPETAGVRTALLGSVFLILITILVAFPIDQLTLDEVEKDLNNPRIKVRS